MHGVAVGMLRIYNTLTKKIEEFKTIRPGEVRAYFCGMTVQDEPHIGHARSFIAMDVLVRYLRYLGYKVMFVRNITDIDDKIIVKARNSNKTTFEVAEEYMRKAFKAFEALKLLPPNVEPRATCHIIEIIELIKKLIDRGYAYVAPNGDVYFSVRKFAQYGKLSGQKIEDLEAGKRIEPGEYKRDPLDFALWKAAKPGEPSWPSPWGRGRPGWHIECSAMSMKYLGETFDIHGGGSDLIFPHHENEIAQSEAATGKKFANYWIHVGLVNFSGDKMSKSIGNVVRVLDVIKHYDPEVIRYWAITTHYRKPIDFSYEALDNAEKALDKLYYWVFTLEILTGKREKGEIREKVREFLESLESDFRSSMNDDLNTPEALGVLHKGLKFISENINEFNSNECGEIASLYRKLGSVFGILEYSLEEKIAEKKKRGKSISEIIPEGQEVEVSGNTKELIELIVSVRSRLRSEKRYDIADYIREELRKLGIILEDTKDGTKWKYA